MVTAFFVRRSSIDYVFLAAVDTTTLVGKSAMRDIRDGLSDRSADFVVKEYNDLMDVPDSIHA